MENYFKHNDLDACSCLLVHAVVFQTMSESRFLMPHKHIIGYSVPEFQTMWSLCCRAVGF